MDCGANIYIGSWVRGVKHGYGVMDDIHQGEKYLGMWESGARNGPGCVVNSDSVYYEQLTPPLLTALHKAHRTGRLGFLQPASHLSRISVSISGRS